MAKVAACSVTISAMTGPGSAKAVRPQRATDAEAAHAVSPAGPSQPISRRPRQQQDLGNSALGQQQSDPRSSSSWDRQYSAAKP